MQPLYDLTLGQVFSNGGLFAMASVTCAWCRSVVSIVTPSSAFDQASPRRGLLAYPLAVPSLLPCMSPPGVGSLGGLVWRVKVRRATTV